MSEFSNLMIDLETLSERPDAAIVAIGAVAFNMEDDAYAEFYINVDPRDGKALGMHISESTVAWWRKQDVEATKAWISNGVSVEAAATALAEFATKHTEKSKVSMWANGIDFDLPILVNFLRTASVEQFWTYWNQLDARTVFKLARFNTKNAPREGKYHNALDDCHNQIRWLKNIVNGTS